MMLIIESEDVQVIPDPAPAKRSRPTRLHA